MKLKKIEEIFDEERGASLMKKEVTSSLETPLSFFIVSNFIDFILNFKCG